MLVKLGGLDTEAHPSVGVFGRVVAISRDWGCGGGFAGGALVCGARRSRHQGPSVGGCSGRVLPIYGVHDLFLLM